MAPVLTEDVHANDAQGTLARFYSLPAILTADLVADKAPTNDSTCVYIKNILPSIARSDLKKVLSSVEGAPLLRLRVRSPTSTAHRGHSQHTHIPSGTEILTPLDGKTLVGQC